MNIKENFYSKLQSIREDYDHVANAERKEYEYLGKAKPRRPGDKEIIRAFGKEARYYAKKAVTGMEPIRKRKKSRLTIKSLLEKRTA